MQRLARGQCLWHPEKDRKLTDRLGYVGGYAIDRKNGQAICGVIEQTPAGDVLIWGGLPEPQRWLKQAQRSAPERAPSELYERVKRMILAWAPTAAEEAIDDDEE